MKKNEDRANFPKFSHMLNELCIVNLTHSCFSLIPRPPLAAFFTAVEKMWRLPSQVFFAAMEKTPRFFFPQLQKKKLQGRPGYEAIPASGLESMAGLHDTSLELQGRLRPDFTYGAHASVPAWIWITFICHIQLTVHPLVLFLTHTLIQVRSCAQACRVVLARHGVCTAVQICTELNVNSSV